MSINHVALARRYRPRTFQNFVGQETILRALTNALKTLRLHHAYLFTGTRGVGKTSLARILAKCLNCELGISATPCDQCSSCVAIDAGHFVDLLEIDAASRTKVEDTRELLDNVQYLPTRGRFKIYLIDEVHMLSSHSFNALLKTLEEPPPHVKFLLATTDPQKLPLTVLSRCLQFHLRRLPVKQIMNHLAVVLGQESKTFEEEALQVLAMFADGSMRDALSLLDQSLAYCEGKLEAKALRSMLGISPKGRIMALLAALIARNAQQVMWEINQLADNVPDFCSVLPEFLSLIHQVTLAQKVPEALDDNVLEKEKLISLASEVSAEELQLYYQIGLLGQRDLPYAPNSKMGFEMILLRMLAFQPLPIMDKTRKENVMMTSERGHLPHRNVSVSMQQKTTPPETPPKSPMEIPFKPPNAPPEIPAKTPQTPEIPQETPSEAPPANPTEIPPQTPVEIPTDFPSPSTKHQASLSEWSDIVKKLNLNGLVKVLAQHCSVATWGEDLIHLVLDESQRPLFNKRHEERLMEALSHYLNRPVPLRITIGQVMENTPATQHKKMQEQVYQRAKLSIDADPHVQSLIQAFGAEVEQVSGVDD